jgi:ABC-type glycerol-3-phosphate transport system substrate-binding protein
MKSLGIFVLVLVVGLTACSKGGKSISTDQGSVTTSADDKTTTITTKEGSMVAGENAVDVAKLGVPVYPGAQQQQGSFAISGQQGSGQMVTFKSTDGFDKIYDWYKSQLPPGAQTMKMDSNGTSIAQFVSGDKVNATSIMITSKGATETDILITKSVTTATPAAQST